MNDLPDLRTVEQLRHAVAQGAELKYLFFWGHRIRKDGQVTQACFSQWFEAPFVLDGTRYASAEHFMMAEKARLFGDLDTGRRILAASSPAEAKALGRKIAGYDEPTWVAHRFDVVVRGNEAKFSQHAVLRDFLCATGKRVLVESSPVDAIWGIGLAADNPDAGQPAAWPGLNLLGFALMEVRARLSST